MKYKLNGDKVLNNDEPSYPEGRHVRDLMVRRNVEFEKEMGAILQSVVNEFKFETEYDYFA